MAVGRSWPIAGWRAGGNFEDHFLRRVGEAPASRSLPYVGRRFGDLPDQGKERRPDLSDGSRIARPQGDDEPPISVGAGRLYRELGVRPVAGPLKVGEEVKLGIFRDPIGQVERALELFDLAR